MTTIPKTKMPETVTAQNTGEFQHDYIRVKSGRHEDQEEGFQCVCDPYYDPWQRDMDTDHRPKGCTGGGIEENGADYAGNNTS